MDADVDSADILGEVLQSYGYRVALAFTPEQALEEAQRFRPSLTILDLDSSTLHGRLLAEEIREMIGLADCAFVAVTADAAPKSKAASHTGGFIEHFRKPLDLNLLLRLLIRFHAEETRNIDPD